MMAAGTRGAWVTRQASGLDNAATTTGIVTTVPAKISAGLGQATGPRGGRSGVASVARILDPT